MRQYDVVDKIGLQRDRRGPAHPGPPKGHTRLAERVLRMVGIEWRQFPQSLLPPHAADQEPKNPVADMLDRALCRHCTIDMDRNGDAAEQEHPKYRRGPGRLQQKLDRVGDRVVVHRTNLSVETYLNLPAAIPRSKFRPVIVSMRHAHVAI